MRQVNQIEVMEDEFKTFVGSKHAVMTINGTSAIHLALLTLNLPPKSRVAVSPFTFSSPVDMLLWCGLKPVFVDIDEETCCMDTNLLKEVVEKEDLKAVLPIHLFGNMCNMDDIMPLSDQYDLFVIEDASQALGAKDSNNRFAGTIGNFGTYSFYASKALWTGGGMLVTNNGLCADIARQIRNHGRNSEGRMVRLGHNFNPPWILAFLGDHMVRLHKESIFAELKKHGPKDGYYPYVVYDEPYYKKMGITGNCPVAEEVAKKVREGTI